MNFSFFSRLNRVVCLEGPYFRLLKLRPGVTVTQFRRFNLGFCFRVLYFKSLNLGSSVNFL